ncbi:MAG TPA: hypothetical protein VLQ92_04170, partial [Candidatus Limnocylindrales bacterium]|nr:hypothetical protein [Candidatus Limnocylindrales bacterium]
MSEFAITLMRFGFLAALWLVVLAIVLVLRRDLAAPKEARPQPATRPAPGLPTSSSPPVPP